jgi:hypothetical protein
MASSPVSNDRQFTMDKGEMVLRTHCGKHAPLKLTLVFGHEKRRWEVLAQFFPEGHPPVLLGQEELDVFPSPELIATAMLVS